MNQPTNLRLAERFAAESLVGQALGTILLAAAMVLTWRIGPSAGWLWWFYGASCGCWVLWIATDRRWQRLGLAALICSAALPAAVLGPSVDSASLIMTCIVLGRLASLTRHSLATVLSTTGGIVTLAAASTLVWRDSWVPFLMQVGVITLVVLGGLNRREHLLRLRQADLLVEQTRRTQDEHARAGAADERARIAREMHDVLAHSLGALGVQLEVAEAMLAERNDTDGALTHVRRSRRLAVDGLAEAKSAVSALRTDTIQPLPAALDGVLDGHRRDHRVPVRFDANGTQRDVASAAAVSLFGVLREALTNAARHAPGAAIDVALTYADDTVRLEVSNPIVDQHPHDRGNGVGLQGMRERLALVGGELHAGQAHDEWRVTATVPA